MKCPKCNYIGFEAADRCRNCGFEFSLASAEQPVPDLALRSPQTMGPLADLDLGEPRPAARVPGASRIEKRRHEGAARAGASPDADALLPGGGDLPLFVDVPADDEPLVRPSAPSAPLAVRRSTPARPRSTPAARAQERSPDPRLPLDSVATGSVGGPLTDSPGATAGDHVAALGPRIGAAAIDWLLLLALDGGVVYFTLRVSRIAASDIALLPALPLALFLLLLNGGYLALFTAATGQTIGKMAFKLKVVSAEDRPLTIGRALLRVGALLVSVLPAGLGLVPAGFDRAHRGLHDRLADTRVVRVSAS
jgi:uncharacterized RDD family membrane protein YckC